MDMKTSNDSGCLREALKSVFPSFVLLSLFANMPMLGHYQPIDYDIAMLAFPTTSPEHLGAWRVLGIAFSKAILHLPLPLIGAAIAIVHACSASALFAVIARVWGKCQVAYLLALLFCVYPWGYGLMTLAAQSQVLIDVFVFMVFMLCYVSIWSERKVLTIRLLCVVFGAALFALLVQDRLAFCYAALGGWALFDIGLNYYKERSKPTLRQLVFCGMPVLALLVYVVLYKLTPSVHLVSPEFRLQAVVSSFVYQYSHYHSFVPWLRPEALAFGFRDWTMQDTVFAVLLGVPAGILAYRVMARLGAQSSSKVKYPWVLCMLLLGGCAFVYAVGGGYSLEIYKKYAFASLIVILVAAFIPGSVLCKRMVRIAVLLIALFFAATAWLHVKYWDKDVSRLYALADKVAENNYEVDQISVSYDIDTRALWGELSILSESMRPGYKFKENLAGLLEYYHPDYSPVSQNEVMLHYTRGGEWVELEQ